MVNAKRVLSPLFPSIPTKHYVNLQILASMLVTLSVAVLLPMTINLQQVGGDSIIANALATQDERNNVFVKGIKMIVEQAGSCVGIAAFTVLLVERAHHKLLQAREASQATGAAELTRYRRAS